MCAKLLPKEYLSFVMVVITLSGLLICKLHFYNMLGTPDFKYGTAYCMPHTICIGQRVSIENLILELSATAISGVVKV